MGVFSVKLTIRNPAQPSKSEELEAMVDTGASYSWISSSRLAGLGIRPSRRMAFRTIEGRMIEREVAAVFVKVDGYTGGDNVVMAEAGDSEVLGAFTLEGLGLAADPVKKVLVPTVGLALLAVAPKVYRRRSGIVAAIDV
ncbi:MAG: aspartyl protease family protein [Terriglobia bacterium]|jgi:predicted aspartyl protease